MQQMQAALATPGLEAGQRHRLHLALGKAADDLGDYALAMQHLDTADAVRRASLSFDSAAFAAEIDRLIARCTPELVARAPELGRKDATPGPDHRHAAVRHHAGRTDRLEPPRGRRRR